VVSLSRHTAPPPAPSLFPYTTLFRSVGNTSVCRTDAYPAVPTIDRLIHPSVKSPEIRMLRQWRVLASCCRRDPGHEPDQRVPGRSEEHTSELQSRENLVCRLLLEKKN